MSAPVLLAERDGVVTLTFNRPAALNTLDVATIHAFRESVEKVATNQSLTCLVLEGAGEHFMAGGDIVEFSRMAAAAPAEREAAFRALIEDWVNPAILTLQQLPVPVIAKLRGACAGIGLSFALGADVIVAADDAVISTAYSTIGLSPDGGGSYFLPRAVGTRRALELYLLAERIDAAEAQRLGIVSKVVPAATLDAEVARIVARLTGGARHAYREIKALVRASAGNTLAQQLAAEGGAFGRCAGTEDFVEGIDAFLAKRKPDFKGR